MQFSLQARKLHHIQSPGKQQISSHRLAFVSEISSTGANVTPTIWFEILRQASQFRQQWSVSGLWNTADCRNSYIYHIYRISIHECGYL